MSVPEEVRRVPRPRNTVVLDTGSKGPTRYAVRARAKSVYIKGHNPQPRNGKTVGHIINMKFVPVAQSNHLSTELQLLSYGSSALVHSESEDLLQDLLCIYRPEDAYRIMAIASIKVLHSNVTHNRLRQQYDRTFIRRYYPGVALSLNTVGHFFEALGQDLDKRQSFYKRRIDRACAEHHIAIDGTLRQDTGTVNNLSAYSRQARVKGCRDLSILYAYNIETMEPVCAEVFAGNIIDAKVYHSFIETNKIDKGLLIADKGFPVKEIEEDLKKHPELHFLSPLKRNDKRIVNNCMLDFDGVVTGIDKRVLCKKKKLSNGRFLYSFKDLSRSHAEENTFIDKARTTKYEKDEYDKKLPGFGTIVFESDQGMKPEVVWRSYDDRWLLELVFDRYKNDLGLSATHVQNEFSVWGEEFVNFIAATLTCRILRRAEKAKLLDKMTFSEMLEDLEQSWRPEKDAEINAIPDSTDGKWVNTTIGTMEMLSALGLVKSPDKPEHKKPGRPRKQKLEFVGPKRPRGRPRKVTPATSSAATPS